MTDIIDDKNLQKAYSDYENGFFITLARETITKGYKLAGLFPYRTVRASKATIVETKPLDQFVDQTTGETRKMAKGTKARRVRGTTVTKDGLQLTYQQLDYHILNEHLADPAINLAREIMSMSYILAMDINDSIINAVRKNAEVIPASKIKGKWDDDTTEYRDIMRDLRRIADTKLDKQAEIDLIAMGSEAKFEVSTRTAVETLPYQIPSTGYTIEKAMQLVDTNCFYGGKDMKPGELFGFDGKQPGLDVIFQEWDNPNIKMNVELDPNLTNLAPPIGMMMYDDSDTEPKPTTIIKMFCAYGMYPYQKGELMVRVGKQVTG